MFRIDTDNTIISCLSEVKDLSMQELYTCVTEKQIKVSLPNFYKIVGRLIDNQVLVKSKGKLQLHAMYLHYIVGLANNIQETYFSDSHYQISHLKPGEQQTFTAPSLYDLDIIWTDLLRKLVQSFSGKEGYYYNSHPYHILSMANKEKENLKDIGTIVEKSYFVFGNNTFLDKYGSELLSMQGYNIVCVENPPFPEEGYCINIVGDYIIECTFPKSITEHYKIFFDTVKSFEGFNVEMFSHLIKMKETATLKLIYSPEHAKKMREKIKSFFK